MIVMKRATRFTTLTTSALLALGVLLPAPAGAHASYDGSNPPDKGTVSAPPSEVWAEFTEPPAQGSTLQIVDPCGQRVDAGDYRYFGYRVTVSMSADKAGRYSANWHVVSDLDSHPTSGTFTFTSTSGEDCPGASDEGSGGGGSKPSKSGDGSSGSSAGETQPAPAAASEDDAEVLGTAVAAEEPKKENNKNGASRKSRARKSNKDKVAPDRDSDEILLLAEERDGEPALSDDLPLGWLLASFGIAALIGAAGGFVYVSIVRR
jgi:methionine-rich copper-binding protein CopC